MGSKKKDKASVLVGGGVSPLTPPFLKVDSDNTWTCMEEKKPRLHHALREGFLPAKNPFAPFGCPRAPPFPIKGGPRQQGEGIQDEFQAKIGDQIPRRTSSWLRLGLRVETEVISPGKDLLVFYLWSVPCRVLL